MPRRAKAEHPPSPILSIHHADCWCCQGGDTAMILGARRERGHRIEGTTHWLPCPSLSPAEIARRFGHV